MNEHFRQIARIAILSLVVGVFIVGHGALAYYLRSHTAVSGALAVGVLALIAIKHLGLLGSLYGLIRRYLRSQ